MKSSVLRASLFTLALCPCATGQGTPSWSYSHTTVWDETTVGPGRAVVRMVAGEVTGGAQLDVLALGGPGNTNLLLLDAVESNTAMLLHGATVRDFDLAPKDPSTGLQELVYVDATGLWRSGWIAGVGFDASDLITTPGSQPWALARKVRCGLVDATAGLDYVGVSQNLRRVMYFGGTQWSTLDTGPRVYEVLLIDWHGDARLEIALLTQDAVTILDATSQEIARFNRTFVPGDAIASFRTGTGSTEGVAWLCQTAGGGAPTLTVLTSAGVAPASLDLADAVALRAGDADADGLDDLIFARANALAPSWLRNLGTTGAPNFTAATRAIAIADPGVPPPNVPCVAPLLTDLNNDEFADLLVPVGGTSMAALVFMVADTTPLEPPDPPAGGPFYEINPLGEALNTDPIPGFFPRCGGEVDGIGAIYDEVLDTLRWSAYFDLIPPTATHLEVRLWKRQVAVPANPPYTDPACLLLRYLPITAAPNPDFTFRAVTEIETTQLSLPCAERALWIEMRLVQISGPIGNPSSFKAWPMYTAVLIGGCAAVDGMLPVPPDPQFNYGMHAKIPLCEPFECTPDWTLVACVPPSPPGSTSVPMVNVRNKRPVLPGTVPTYPPPTGSGVVVTNDAP